MAVVFCSPTFQCTLSFTFSHAKSTRVAQNKLAIEHESGGANSGDLAPRRLDWPKGW